MDGGLGVVGQLVVGLRVVIATDLSVCRPLMVVTVALPRRAGSRATLIAAVAAVAAVAGAEHGVIFISEAKCS